MKLIRITVLLIALLIPAGAFAGNDLRSISVTGESETLVRAQKAVVYIDVTQKSKLLGTSHDLLIKTLDAMTGDLLKAGMKANDIKRSLIGQGETHKWVKDNQVRDGYYSDCQVELHIDSIVKIGGVYKALSGHRAVTIQNTEFKRDDEDELRAREYEKALIKAKDKAAMMAGTLGARLGKVHTIVEAGAESILVESKGYSGRSGLAAKPAAPAPASYGNITINARVAVIYELK